MNIGTIPKCSTAEIILGTFAWLAADPENRRVRIRGIWPARDLDLAGYRSWFRSCLADKINRFEPVRGRKVEADWQRDAARAARRVNTPRLIVRDTEIPREFRHRLAHRLAHVA